MASEIDKLNQDIQKLQGEKNILLFEIQQKQHEIHTGVCRTPRLGVRTFDNFQLERSNFSNSSNITLPIFVRRVCLLR